MRAASFLLFASLAQLALIAVVEPGCVRSSPSAGPAAYRARGRAEPARVAASAPASAFANEGEGRSELVGSAASRGTSSANEPSPADEDALLRLLATARGESDPSRRREMLVAVCLRWAGFDPPAAISLAGDLRLDPGEGALLANLAQQWAARDFPAALDWAGRLPSGALRDEVYSRFVYERARIDPGSAAELLEDMRAGTPAREQAARTVMYFWKQEDPEEPGARELR